jgi:L-fuconolactonase
LRRGGNRKKKKCGEKITRHISISLSDIDSTEGMNMDRRAFLATAAASLLDAQPAPVPMIDTHIHLFDQTRPQGAPYSGGVENKEPSLPPRYRKLAQPLGIVGAIAVEASPWIEDNLWLLETSATDPMMVGVVGNFRVERPEFHEYLDRYQKNKLFRGIRYGNLWGYDLTKQVDNPVFIEGLKLLEQADLSLDTANPRPNLLDAVIKVSDRVPGLRIIVDHLPGMLLQGTHADASIRELAKRNQIYVKISEVMQVRGQEPVLDPSFYRPTLDYLFDAFGEDRVIFGSDWPNSVAVNHLPAIVRIAQDYFDKKSHQVAEKFFWRNSLAAYKWIRRDASQP